MKTVEKSNFPPWSQKAGAPGGRPGRYPEFSRRFSRACRARFSSSLAPTGPSPSRDLPRWAATMDRIRREVLTEVGLGKISNSARTDGRMRGPWPLLGPRDPPRPDLDLTSARALGNLAGPHDRTSRGRGPGPRVLGTHAFLRLDSENFSESSPAPRRIAGRALVPAGASGPDLDLTSARGPAGTLSLPQARTVGLLRGPRRSDSQGSPTLPFSRTVRRCLQRLPTCPRDARQPAGGGTGRRLR